MVLADLSSRPVTVRGISVREHLPEGDPITPNVTSVRKCAIVDGLWSIPEEEERQELVIAVIQEEEEKEEEEEEKEEEEEETHHFTGHRPPCDAL